LARAVALFDSILDDIGMPGMYNLNDLFDLMTREGAEELRLDPGRPPVMVLQGRLRVIDGALLTTENVAELFRSIATKEQRRELDQCGDIHFNLAVSNSDRFNVSATIQGEQFSLCVRNMSR
jgi:Tfp pilus assembly ATPase PilU